MTDNPAQGEAVTFEAQIKPLFREKDRQAMSSRFDLWSYDSVKAHADAIVAQLRAGTMPCDGGWPPARIQLFERWMETGELP